jgi:mRNA interferase MazF
MAARYPVKIKAAPKVGSIYWCSLHPENVIHLPEFWKKRPVVVISRKNTLHGKVIVLPVTTDDDNEAYENSIELSKATADKINGKRCWVVCDHPMTVATSRLDFIDKSPPRIEQNELGPIVDKCHSLLAGWPGSVALSNNGEG